MSSLITGRSSGIFVDPGNVEELLTAVGCKYTAYDPGMIKNHEEYCDKCKAKRAKQ